jgi:hypothetical protein
MDAFSLERDLEPGVYPLLEIVDGLADSPALRDRFGDDLEDLLEDVTVEVMDFEGYMWVDTETDARIVAASDHWRGGHEATLYLDLVHELVHVDQHRDGAELFDDTVDYVDRETEVDAYEVTVAEARRVGWDDEAIREYLEVPWISAEEHRRLCKRMGVAPP